MSDFTASGNSPLGYLNESSNAVDQPLPPAIDLSKFNRWSLAETTEIEIIRKRLGSLLTDRPQYPDVVGDRKIVRYLRGHEHDLDKVEAMMRKTLQWRDENQIDTVVRHNILHNGYDHPSKFPKGDVLTKLIPGIILHHAACDKSGSPICVDTYNFSPGEVLRHVTQEEYIHFMIYVLEYRSLILEQMSEEREKQALAKLAKMDAASGDATAPYGVMLQTCVVRDLSGLGLEFLGANGKSLLRSVVSLASDNYPETLRKSYMINTPWLFNTVWYFIKGFITVRTVNKVLILGSNYLSSIAEEVDLDMLPQMVGGRMSNDVPIFKFDYAYLEPSK